MIAALLKNPVLPGISPMNSRMIFLAAFRHLPGAENEPGIVWFLWHRHAILRLVDRLEQIALLLQQIAHHVPHFEDAFADEVPATSPPEKGKPYINSLPAYGLQSLIAEFHEVVLDDSDGMEAVGDDFGVGEALSHDGCVT